MSKKNLLNEAQVRKFMKLASLVPLTPGFVGGLTEKAAFKKGEETESGEEAYVNESDDELEEGHGRGRGEGPAGYGSPVDAGRSGSRLREE